MELISKGRHERFVIDKAKFDAKMKEKAEKRAKCGLMSSRKT